MANKNYVKKFKGFDVPEGATHFNESNMLYPSAFYDAADGTMFKVGDGRWKAANGSIPSTAIELPTIPKINWGEQPSPDAVWIVDNEEIHVSTWHSDLIDGGYKEVNSSRSWSKEAERKGRITVYRREDCAVETVRHVHADLMIEYANDPSIEIEYESLGVWSSINNPSFAPERNYRKKPLKTKREKEREAFVDAALVILNKYNPENVSNGLAAMFEAGFTAPKGEGDE